VLILRATTQTVYLNIESVFSPTNLSGLKQRKGGVKNEQEGFGRSTNRYFSGYNCGGSRSHSCDYVDYNRNELYGIYNHANCRATLSVARRSIGSRRNRGLYDARCLNKGCVLNGEEKFNRTTHWNISCRHHSDCGSYSRDYKRNWIQRQGNCGRLRVWSEHFNCGKLLDWFDCNRSQPVPVAGCSAGFGWNCGLYDSARVEFEADKGNVQFPSFSFFYSPTTSFINTFSVSVSEAN
jgi:hypothetical protein